MKVTVDEWGGDSGIPPTFRIEFTAETMQDAALLVRMATGFKREPVDCSMCAGPGGDFMGLLWVPRTLDGGWIFKRKGKP